MSERRAIILRALEACSTMCLDTARERELVAAAVDSLLDTNSDAQLIRAFWVNAPTEGTRQIAFSGSHGSIQSAVLEAAYALAGGRQTSLAETRESSPQTADAPRATTVLPPRPKRARRSRVL
jgi:hypothetical protein